MGRPAAELERYAGQALSAEHLAKIWRTLDEKDRFGFVLSLDEAIADLVIVLTMPAQWLAEREIEHGEKPS